MQNTLVCTKKLFSKNIYSPCPYKEEKNYLLEHIKKESIM